MAIKTMNGNTQESLEDVGKLSQEELERFKKEYNGMTPEEAARQYTKASLMYGARHIIPDLVREVIQRDIEIKDIYEECSVKKNSKLRSMVRQFVCAFCKTEEGMQMITEIVNDQIAALHAKMFKQDSGSTEESKFEVVINEPITEVSEKPKTETVVEETSFSNEETVESQE